MSSRRLIQKLAVGLLVISGCVAMNVSTASGQEEITRKVRSKVAPTYPDLARRMNITGVVKIQVTVTTAGMVKNPKVIGGHPVLANAAMDAIRKWRYEPGSEEITGIVEFRFDPTQ